MTKEEQIEYDKCIASPAYFHNKYMVYDGKRDLTDEEYFGEMERINAMVLRHRRKSFKYRDIVKSYPLTGEDVFEFPDPCAGDEPIEIKVVDENGKKIINKN